MATFVWDMAPRRYNLLMTWKLAQLLQQKGQEVYYIYYKDADFMLGLLKQRLNCGVIYPDDFCWLRPDLVLLDCLWVDHAPFYRERGIPYAYVAMQSPERTTDLNADIPVLFLSPAILPLPPAESGRATEQLRRQRNIRKGGTDTFIIGLLDAEDRNMQPAYQSIRQTALCHPDYHFILLTEKPQVAQDLFVLSANVEIHQQLHLEEVMKECSVALTSDHPDAWLECTFAGLPFIPMSDKEVRRMTPWKLERQIVETLKHQDIYRKNERDMCRYFEEENHKLDAMADRLIAMAECKTNE